MHVALRAYLCGALLPFICGPRNIFSANVALSGFEFEISDLKRQKSKRFILMHDQAFLEKVMQMIKK
jgi:hypothetical protein